MFSPRNVKEVQEFLISPVWKMQGNIEFIPTEDLS